jgi:hypothetical protein
MSNPPSGDDGDAAIAAAGEAGIVGGEVHLQRFQAAFLGLYTVHFIAFLSLRGLLWLCLSLGLL